MRVLACHMSVSVAALAGMLGCSDAIGPICTDEARPGILVTVRDSGCRTLRRRHFRGHAENEYGTIRFRSRTPTASRAAFGPAR